MDFEVCHSMEANTVGQAVNSIPFRTTRVSWLMERNENYPTHICDSRDGIPSMGESMFHLVNS